MPRKDGAGRKSLNGEFDSFNVQIPLDVSAARDSAAAGSGVAPQDSRRPVR